MKQFIQIIVFSVFILCNLAKAQPYGWFTQSSGTTNNLNNLYFLDNNTGFVVGNSGIILKTTNGGTNWATLNSAVPSHMFAISFVNANTGFAVGDVGTILKTTNAGTNWVAQNSTVPYLLAGIYFSNATTGIVVGWYSTVLRTTNGGTTWTQIQNINIESQNLNCVHFYDANNGIAAGNLGKVIKTSNGGLNWTAQTSGTSFGLEGSSYLNSTSAILVGEAGNIRKTTNSGINWNNQSSGTNVGIRGVQFLNQNTGFYAGDNGTIRNTSTGGTSWIAQVSGTSIGLSKVFFTDSVKGTAVGNNGTIIRTTTGGWLLPAQPTLASPNNAAGCIPLTQNLDWNDVAAPTATYNLQIAINTNFDTLVLDQSGITTSNLAVPVNILNYNKTYYWRVRATNSVGTGTFSAVRNFITKNPTPGNITLAEPVNSATGVTLTPLLNWGDATSVSGYKVQVARDSNFTNLVLDSSNVAVSQITVPGGRLDNNTLYYWRVNGSNNCETSAWSAKWKFTTTVELPISPVLVSPPNGTVGVPLNPNIDWLDIASAQTYRIIISRDSTFETNALDSSGITASSFAVPEALLNGGTWYYWRVSATNEAGAGAWSADWKFQTMVVTGLMQNTGAVPSEYILAQNYPNPFNPVTRIEFGLPESAAVSLDIYNQTGERVARLVNNTLAAGTYAYRFDASKFASGIYYYRLNAGDFVQTKRMVLIK